MVATDEVSEIFADARQMHESALEKLAEGDIRDAAEKAWCATLRATQSLILARTGEGPATTAVASDGLDALARQDSRCETLKARYYSRIYHLHAQCFYNGRCASPEIRRRIIETADYIRDAEALAYE